MSHHIPLPDFDLVANTIEHRDPAEIHGILCGMLCADSDITVRRWIDQVNSETTEVNLLGQDTLQEIFKATVSQLGDMQMSFQLLLPDDDQELADRTAALSRWCQGFLFGLGLAIDSDYQLPAELQEFFTDLTKLSQVNFLDTGDATESDEADYAEIVEYIRVGVMLTNQELQTRSLGNNTSARLH